MPAYAETNACCNAFKYKQVFPCNLPLGDGSTNPLIFKKWRWM